MVDVLVNKPGERVQLVCICALHWSSVVAYLPQDPRGDMSHTDHPPPSANSPIVVSQHLLDAYRQDESVDRWRNRLEAFDDSALSRVREDRKTALAFWLNCYNAGTQHLLEERSDLYESPLRFVRFFHAPAITVAETPLPLDRIEHGILRAGRSKYGFGYLPKLSVTSFERSYRLSECDPRIHFALNCGAESCPAIRFYDPEAVDEQLEQATRGYLESTVEYDPDGDVVRVPRVFLWYRGDFGGGSGIRDFLQRYDAIPDGATPSLRHQPWDWSRAAGKFADVSSP